MVNTNVRSGFFIARELGRRMQAIAKGGGIKGRMLFITSLHAETPRNIPHYSASKAGQTMVVKELARALGPAGIRVNALAPGAVPGGGFNAAAFDFDGKIPLGRLGTGRGHGRHGAGAAVRPLLRLRHRHHRRRRRRHRALQLDPFADRVKRVDVRLCVEGRPQVRPLPVWKPLN